MSASLRRQDKQITIANRFIYYYASFIRGIYGFAVRREGKDVPGQRYVGHMEAARIGRRDTEPAIDEIVLFRYRKRLMLGYCREILDRRRGAPGIQVIVEDHRRLRLHMHDLVCRTGLSVAQDRAFLRTYASSVRELSARIDLKEIWDLVSEGEEVLSIREIADLYWEGEMDASRRVALHLHLEHTCPYFETQSPDTYVPMSAHCVAARQRRREQIASLGHEYNEFIHWFSLGEEEPYDPETLTKRHRAWLEGVRQYALWGNGAQNRRQTRNILSEIPSEAGDRQQHAFQLLVRKGIWKNEEDLELERAGVSLRFPEEALRAAERIDIAGILRGRKMLRRHVFALEDEDRHKPELGISLRRRWWRQGYELGVHFADVASLVPTDSALERAASDRMATLPLPNRCLPMLPPRISGELGRLKGGEQRPALSILCTLSRRLEVKGVRILPTAIAVSEVLVASDIEAICAGRRHPLAKPIRVINQFTDKLKARREASGAMRPFAIPEMCVIVEDEKIDVQVIHPEGTSSRVIRELAILSAVAVGEYCVTQGLPAVFEAQKDPADRKILEQIPNPVVRRHEIRRQTPPPALSADPGSHHCLGISALACVASPLQRYPDLMVQRQVLHHLLCGDTMYDEEDIQPIRYRAQQELGELEALRHKRQRHWLLKHLSSSLGESLSAVVLHIRRDGALVELMGYPLKIVVRPNGPVSIGDEVNIRLSGVNLWKSEAHGSII